MLGHLRKIVTENTWTYALPAGLVSSAYVVANSPQSGVLEYGVVFWAGLVGGLLTFHGSDNARRVGAQTGLVGSLPIAWDVAPIFGVIPTFDQPVFFGGLQAMMLFTLISMAVLFVCMVGALGGTVGGWFFQKISPEKPATVRS